VEILKFQTQTFIFKKMNSKINNSQPKGTSFLTKLPIIILFGTFYIQSAQAQIKIGTNPNKIEKSSLLELESQTEGLLLPRLIDTLAINLLNPPSGMLIYLTKPPRIGLYVRKPTGWDFLNGSLNGINSVDTDKIRDGAVGPQGPIGNTGATGATGPQGLPGTNGANGTDGAIGAKGDKGDTGATGLTGATGPQGLPGTNGADGTAGAIGAKGDKGDTGATGLTGATGPQGVPGTNGADGADGAIGAKGDKGDTGATGLTGATGPQGVPGTNGTNGTDGAIGAKGDKGDTGNTGATGATGPAGADGTALADANSTTKGKIQLAGDLGGSAEAPTVPALANKVDKVTGKSLIDNTEITRLAAITGTNTGDQTDITGNAGTATKLATTKTINGVAFDGTIDIIVTADAGTLTGATLNPTVRASSLTSVGTLVSLEVNGAATNTNAYNAATSSTIDFTKSNLAYTTNSPASFTLSGIKDGGTYTLAVQGTTSGTSTFSTSGFTFMSVNNGPTTSGKQTLYTFIVMGTTVYYFMAAGF
jgi:hypothetical protein